MKIVEEIDQAIGCQQCGEELSASVSDDFCSESCQMQWHRKRVDAPNEMDLPSWEDAIWQRQNPSRVDRQSWLIHLHDANGQYIRTISGEPLHSYDMVQAPRMTWTQYLDPETMPRLTTRRFDLHHRDHFRMEATYIEVL